MHNDTQMDALAHRLTEGSPGSPTPESLDRVREAATTGATRNRGNMRTRTMVSALAGAAVVLAVSLAVANGGSGSAFAKEDALAALYPSNGDIVHLRTTGYVYNEGEPVPPEDQREIEESWIDYKGERARMAWLKATTGEKTGEIITTDGTWWRVGDNFETPEPDRILQVSPSRMRPGSLDAYEYLKAALPDGDVVGEVERNGDAYWDIRWRNDTDKYGLKFSARALLRKSDYRPALIEHSYPGGAQSRWEVLEWSVTPAESLRADLFEPASLAEPDLPEVHVWFESELADKTSHPVYSAGDEVGSHKLLEYEAGQGTYVRYRLFENPSDIALAGDRVAADYMDEAAGKIAVSVSTTGTISAESLASSLTLLEPVATAKVNTTLGTATIATLRDGSSLAVLPLADATIAVHSADRELVLKALAGLKRVR